LTSCRLSKAFLTINSLTSTFAATITIAQEMNQATDPVFKLILSVGLGGILLLIFGILDRRDLLALAGAILIASSISTIARLVK
jgi:hypothetical protein